MKIIFMGTPDFAAVILQALLDSEHEVCCVATQPDKAKDRGKKIQFTRARMRSRSCSRKKSAAMRNFWRLCALMTRISAWSPLMGRSCRKRS